MSLTDIGKFVKKLLKLTKSQKKLNKKVKKLNGKVDKLLERHIHLEAAFKAKEKDDDKYKDKVDEVVDFMNNMKGQIEQARMPKNGSVESIDATHKLTNKNEDEHTSNDD